MNSRIREAFDAVHAEESLKESTRAFLEQRTPGSRARRGWWAGQRLALAAACLLLVALGVGGWWLYFTPTATISIEVNPYVELGVNRFDQVVSAVGRNDDGEALVENLDLRFLSYDQAVEEIVSDDQVSALLAQDEVMTIAVIGADETQCGRLLTRIQSCTAGQQNTYCYCASGQEAAAAEDVGLSCGKYRAYLALKELDPSITPEQVRSMTMGELQRLIDQLTYGTQDQPVQDAGQTGENSAGNDTGTGSTSSGGTGGNGHGHCGGHGGCWQ